MHSLNKKSHLLTDSQNEKIHTDSPKTITTHSLQAMFLSYFFIIILTDVLQAKQPVSSKKTAIKMAAEQQSTGGDCSR